MVTWDEACLRKACLRAVCLLFSLGLVLRGGGKTFLKETGPLLFVLSSTAWNVQTAVMGLVSPLWLRL